MEPNALLPCLQCRTFIEPKALLPCS